MKLTHQQTSHILDDIALQASAMERLILEWAKNPNSELAKAMPDVLLSLVQRIGWAADCANNGSGLRGDAVAWMLPSIGQPKD